MFDRFWLCFCLWRLVGVFGDTDTVKSVLEGDSVTLKIVTQTQTGEKIAWKFGTNRILLARIKGNTSNIFDGPDERFRDRLKLDHQTGFLIITNIRTTDSGLYEAEISRSSSDDKHRFNVTVYGSPSPRTDSVSLIIVVISVAAAGSLLIVAVIVTICICRKHRDAVHADETLQISANTVV